MKQRPKAPGKTQGFRLHSLVRAGLAPIAVPPDAETAQGPKNHPKTPRTNRSRQASKPARGGRAISGRLMAKPARGEPNTAFPQTPSRRYLCKPVVQRTP